MPQLQRLTCIINREDDLFVSLCPELDIASQGSTVEEARANLVEALELFLESADPSEIKRRLNTETYITPIEVRRRGSHIIMQNRLAGTTTTVPVPDHRELKTETLLSIIRQSGMPRSAFEVR